MAAPTHVITTSTVGAYSRIGLDRSSRYTPAVTSVAAWIRALTGVGPSMASIFREQSIISLCIDPLCLYITI